MSRLRTLFPLLVRADCQPLPSRGWPKQTPKTQLEQSVKMRLDPVLRHLLNLDRFLLLLLATVLLATVLPVRGRAVAPVQFVTDLMVALLFFVHGAKLSRQAIAQGIGAWKIHLTIALATFALFPLLGLIAQFCANLWLNPMIGAGLLLLCLMPSTVQSSIAFTSMAGGNTPAAVCSASASSIFGIFLTPLIASLLMSAQHGVTLTSNLMPLVLQIFLPFTAGHLARPLIRGILEAHGLQVSLIDRSVILLVVYTAFSAAVINGIWAEYSFADLGWTAMFCVALLVGALSLTTLAARALKLPLRDEIAVVFCGSKKSLAAGVPFASALFPSALVGPLILPLMLFHQIQLIACTVLARRYRNLVREASV